MKRALPPLRGDCLEKKKRLEGRRKKKKKKPPWSKESPLGGGGQKGGMTGGKNIKKMKRGYLMGEIGRCQS